MLPSDLAAEATKEIDKSNYKSSIKKIIDKFIKTHNVIKLDNYDANDLVSSLILNPCYRTDYEELFPQMQLRMIEKYSVKCQLEEIFKLWMEEKERLSDVGQIVYLFERMVFLPFFPEGVTCGKLNDFLSIKNSENSEYIFACRRILKCINEYENYKRKRQQYESAEFFIDKAKDMEQELEKFQNQRIAPIIECVTRNYIGLSYLNFYFSSKKDESEEEDKKSLELAKGNFQRVIKLSEEKFSDKVEVFQAFAKYNLARVKRNLGDKADSEYNSAIDKRKYLSEVSCFPEIFKLNFELERIYAEIDYFDYMKEKGVIDLNNYRGKLRTLSEELDNIRKTPASDVSLFETLKYKIEHKIGNL